MNEMMLGVGLVVLGATLLSLTTTLYQARRRTRKLRIGARQALGDFSRRAFHALAQTRPERSNSASGWKGSRNFYVARKVAEARDVYSYYLKPCDGKPVPLFVPGQHLTVKVAIPGEPQQLTRCYSLSEAPLSSDQYRITVKRLDPPSAEPLAPRSLVSNHFHETMHQDATLNVRAPSGNFCLDFADDRPVVLMAGGIGVTPIMSMLNATAAFGQTREAWLFYGIRNRGEHAFHHEIQQAAQRHGNIYPIVCYSRPTKTCVKGRDYDHHGHITVDSLKSVLPHKSYVFYVCGPSGMMETITRDLRAWGVPEQDIRTEAFAAATVKVRPAPRCRGDSPAGTPLSVKFIRSGKTVNWSSECDVLLDLAECNGINLYTGCRAGQCGSCMVSVAKGKVRHLVEPGLPLNEGFCLPCVGVPESELVLDA